MENICECPTCNMHEYKSISEIFEEVKKLKKLKVKNEN